MRAAVLGSPVAHSLSPVLHAAGYAELGLTDWSYGRVELQAADLPGFVAGLDDDWRGLSLTMPLKEACLEVAAEVTPLARRAGAGTPSCGCRKGAGSRTTPTFPGWWTRCVRPGRPTGPAPPSSAPGQRPAPRCSPSPTSR